jgi:hypothetical protein
MGGEAMINKDVGESMNRKGSRKMRIIIIIIKQNI